MFPVFIGGHPRSGTTLLGAMVGSHSECICTPESPFKINGLRQPSVKGTGRSDINVGSLMEFIRNDWKFKIWGLHLPEYSSGEMDSYQTLFRFIVNSYGRKHGKPDARIWVDHTPSNIKYASLLTSFYPQAKFIHLVRDGRGVAASIMSLDWGVNTIDRAAHSWSKRLTEYIHVEELLGSEKIIRLGFEDLVKNPESAMKRICEFIGIVYQPEMVRGSGFQVPHYTSKQHSLVGKAPNPAEADAWEKVLRPRQIEIFENIAGDVLSSLGYHLRYGKTAQKMTMKERVIANIQEIVKREVINKARHWRRIKKGIASASRPHDS